MLAGNISPFDEALSRPFLDEPTRKKWCVSKPSSSWFYSTSSTSTTASCSDEDDGDDYESVSFESDEEDGGNGAAGDAAHQAQWGRGASLCNPFDGYDDELIMANCGGGESRHSNPAAVLGCSSSSSSPATTKRSQTRPITLLRTTSKNPLTLPTATYCCDDSTTTTPTTEEPDMEEQAFLIGREEILRDNLELALFRERTSELSDIAGSMRQIHDIQQDLALVVDSQDSDIHRMSWKSMEAFDQAQSGLGHLVETVKNRQERKSRLYSWIASAAVVMAVCYIIAGLIPSSTTSSSIRQQEDPHPLLAFPISSDGSPHFRTPFQP